MGSQDRILSCILAWTNANLASTWRLGGSRVTSPSHVWRSGIWSPLRSGMHTDRMTPAASVEFWAAPWVRFWIELAVVVGNASVNVDLNEFPKSYGRCLEPDIDPYPYPDNLPDRGGGLVSSLSLGLRASPAAC
jgi:hypothetical protein